MLDEYTRQCLADQVGRKTRAHDVLEACSPISSLGTVRPSICARTTGQQFTAKLVAEMAGQAAGPDPLHRAGQSVGERLQRELQRQTERRVLERRDLLHTARGNGTRRARWRRLYNTVRPHRAHGGLPPRPRDDKTIALVPQKMPQLQATTDGSGSNIGSGTANWGHNHGTIWEWFGPISKKRDKHNRVPRCHLT